MIPKSELRFVKAEDASAIKAIYAPAVTREDVATSFELEVPSVGEIEKRIQQKTQTYPWLVWEEAGQVVGFAYSEPHRSRGAYKWCVDVSVYVDPIYHRMGIGRQLYTTLFKILKHQGVVNAYAGVTLPNPASVTLHQSLGFKLVGVYRSVGFKHNKCHSVGWWHLALQTWPSKPKPIIPFHELEKSSLI